MRLPTGTKRALAGLVLVIATGAGVARAGIPSPDGSIDGCLNPTTGALRAVDTQAGQGCSSFERTVRWNLAGQQGTQGPVGPTGPAGPRGPAGPAGPSGPQSIIVDHHFGLDNAYPVRGCSTQGNCYVDELTKVGGVYLPPGGNWEILVEVAARNDANRPLADNTRLLLCAPYDMVDFDEIRILMSSASPGTSYSRVSATYLVSTKYDASPSWWTIRCGVPIPGFAAGDQTGVWITKVKIIARLVELY